VYFVDPFERLSTFEFLADDALPQRSVGAALESTAGASHPHDCQQWLDAGDVQHTREVLAEYDVPTRCSPNPTFRQWTAEDVAKLKNMA
jgi:hypothetical protein